MKDSLGNRMKGFYEDRYRIKLSRRTPVIIRLDGNSFHTLTKRMEKPFDSKFIESMSLTADALIHNIQGCKATYVQSDEISLLLTDYDKLTTEAWFDYSLQKMVSISAAMASVAFVSELSKFAVFDSRAFNVPREDVTNYFIWRQKDWTRNSLQMLARSHYLQSQLHGKKQVDMHEMLHVKGINWNELPGSQKNGTFFLRDKTSGIIRKYVDLILTDNREMIEDLLIPLED